AEGAGAASSTGFTERRVVSRFRASGIGFPRVRCALPCPGAGDKNGFKSPRFRLKTNHDGEGSGMVRGLVGSPGGGVLLSCSRLPRSVLGPAISGRSRPD